MSMNDLIDTLEQENRQIRARMERLEKENEALNAIVESHSLIQYTDAEISAEFSRRMIESIRVEVLKDVSR